YPFAVASKSWGNCGKVPLIEIVEARFGLECAQHFPTRVVKQHDDWVEPITAAIAQVPAGHLECAIADKHNGTASRRRSHTETRRNAKTHAGVIARCGKRSVLNLHCDKKAVTYVRRHGRGTVPVKQVVDRGCDVGWDDRFVVGWKVALVGRRRRS